MDSKTNNRFYLFFILILLLADLIIGLDGLILSQAKYLLCMAVGIVLLKRKHTPIPEVLPYDRGLKLSTALLICILTVCMLPVTTFLSAFGANTFGDISELVAEESIFGENLLSAIVTTAVFPAVFEELFFRGFFFASFRKARGPRFAILVSAALFGIFHMNFQQAIYAFVLGILLAVLREMTGSMWAGMLFHFVNNGTATAAYFMSSYFEEAELTMKTNTMLTSAAWTSQAVAESYELLPLIGPALLGAAISYVLLLRIAKVEGKVAELRSFFSPAVVSPDLPEAEIDPETESDQEEEIDPETELSHPEEELSIPKPQPVVTIPLILGILICAAVMVLLMFADKLLL